MIRKEWLWLDHERTIRDEYCGRGKAAVVQMESINVPMQMKQGRSTSKVHQISSKASLGCIIMEEKQTIIVYFIFDNEVL